MNRKLMIMMIVLIILGLVGVYFYQNNQNKQEKNSDYQPQEEISDDQMRETMVSLYFNSKDNNQIVPEGRLIDVKLLVHDPYVTLVNLLIAGPKNEKLETTIPEGTKINKAEINADIVTIDLSQEFIQNHMGGEEAETKTIQSIVNTLTELTEINAVRITIDGQKNQEFQDHKVNFKEAFTRQK